MELEYTWFRAEDGFFVGWFDNFPEDVTQGKTGADPGREKSLRNMRTVGYLSGKGEERGRQ